MSRFVVLLVLIMVVMLMSIAAMYSLGATLQDAGIATYLEDHVHKVSGIWCWRSICPKRTSFTQAKLQIEASGEKILQNQIANLLIELQRGTYLNFYSMDSSETSPITVIDVDLRQNAILLGDAYQLFGMPTVVWLGTENMPISNRGICFKGGVCAYFDGDEAKLSPFIPITGLSIYGSNDASLSKGYQPWRGFISLR